MPCGVAGRSLVPTPHLTALCLPHCFHLPIPIPTQIATGHNADDVAETVLLNILRGDVPRWVPCLNSRDHMPSKFAMGGWLHMPAVTALCR